MTNAAGTVLAGKTIAWASSRPDVATVSSDGLVTGVTTGVAVVTATSEGQSASVGLKVEGPNRIVLTSETGDYIGGGRTYTYTNANAILQVTNDSEGLMVRVLGNERWDGQFEVPSGRQLAPASYANAIKWGGVWVSEAGLNWGGEGRGCSDLRGSFTIDSLIWGAGVGSTLVSLDLRFEQHCEGFEPALRGTIHWRDDDRTVPPGPLVPIPASLWRPPAGATPAAGDFVYVESDSGDWVGQGATTLYQGSIVVTILQRLLHLKAGGIDMSFYPMNSIPEWKVGYYGGLMRYPFCNPTIGCLDIGMDSRGCNRLSGWFAVDRVHYTNGALAGMELRFVQHCEEGTPALRGAVRWGQFTG